MKTTLEISDDLLLRAKQIAQQQGVTVRSLVETGLAWVLQEHPERPVITPVTFGRHALPAPTSLPSPPPPEPFRDPNYRVT